MRLNEFTLKFFLLLIAQILIWNYFNFSQYLTVVFLPAMILVLPIERSTNHAMVLSFICGLFVDFFCGMMGLTSLALVLAAFIRRPVIRLSLGTEVFSRNENISFHRQSWAKILLAILLLTAAFLVVYIWADGAGTRPTWFNIVRFLLSLLVSTGVSLFVADILCSDLGEKWK